MEQGSPAFDAAQPMLAQLLKAEMAEREVRSIAYHMKVARFPAYKDLSGFEFASSEVNEALVRQLHRCEFLDGAHNIVLIGGPGTGKSHIATAIGVQAIEHHRKKVRFFSTVELVNALEQEEAAGKAGKIAESLVRADLVILDELLVTSSETSRPTYNTLVMVVLPVLELPGRRLLANLGTEPRLRHLNEQLFANLRHARELIAAWRDDYNQHYPRTSLDGLTPWEYHQQSVDDQTLNRANQ